MRNSHHIEMLAKGLGGDMLSEIRQEINFVDSSLRDLSLSPSQLRPDAQFAIKRMKGYIPETEKVSTCLFAYERKIAEIKRQKSIQEIYDIEKKLQHCDSLSESGRLNRQLTHLKSIHARKLSDLNSNQQKMLHERLKLINIWKSILNYEIHILEDCKSIIIKKIVETANASGSSEIIDMVRGRLRSLSVKDTVISQLKIDKPSAKIANIHILYKTIEEQLNDVERVETVVQEKRRVVQMLNSIANDIRSQLPDAPPEEAPAMFPGQTEESVKAISARSYETYGRQSRMIYREREK
ncbi:MAG: hypothetical protein ACP5I1_12745 [Candidatus Hinthialibacter sp.]